jgi:DNA excision repair protein ERCC-6-like 2
LNEIYLRRTKDVVLADELPDKDERIIFCDPSPLQKELYRHILKQPDFVLMAESHGPCDCGVNKKVRISLYQLHLL